MRLIQRLKSKGLFDWSESPVKFNVDSCQFIFPLDHNSRHQALDESQMHEEKKDEKKCIQEFGYNIGKVRFQTSYRDVEKKIQKEWKKILEAERTEALLPYRNQ